MKGLRILRVKTQVVEGDNRISSVNQVIFHLIDKKKYGWGKKATKQKKYRTWCSINKKF